LDIKDEEDIKYVKPKQRWVNILVNIWT